MHPLTTGNLGTKRPAIALTLGIQASSASLFCNSQHAPQFSDWPIHLSQPAEDFLHIADKILFCGCMYIVILMISSRTE